MSDICPGKHPEHLHCSAYFCVNSATVPVARSVSPNFIEEFDERDFVAKDPLDESVARRPRTVDVVGNAGKHKLLDANVPGLVSDGLPPSPLQNPLHIISLLRGAPP